MGSEIGILKVAARRVGLNFETYIARVKAGEKWCYKCNQWKQINQFNLDKSRGDGHTAACIECRRVKVKIDTKGRPSIFKGRTHSPEARKKMSEARIGNQNKTGKRLSKEQRAFISQRTKIFAVRGEQSPNWKGGVGALRANRGLTPEDIAWREAVYQRDNYTCQHCGDNGGGNLNAHHLKEWADYPELRHVVDNGITLCKPCHDKVHYGYVTKQTRMGKRTKA